MNPRNTFILVLVTAGLFAFIFFFERHIKKPEPEIQKILPGLDASKVSSIQIQPAGADTIRMERAGDGWQLTKPMLYRAQGAPIELLLRALELFSPQTRISAQELVGKHNVDKEFGFDKPQAVLTIEQGSELHTLILGSLTAPGDQVYAQVVGYPYIDIVDANLLKIIHPRANDWRDTTFVNLSGVAFDHLSVSSGAKTFELQYDSTNKLWRLTLPGNMQARADNSKISKLLYDLQTLRVSGFVTDATNADPEMYGFQTPSLELRFQHGTNRLVVYQFGKSPTNNTGQIYARREGQPAVVSIAKAAIDAWRGDPSEYRDPHLLNVAGVDFIEENNGTNGFVVRKDTNGVWLVAGPKSFPADTNLINSYLSQLAGLTVVRGHNGDFAVKDVVTPEEFPKYGLDPPVRRYVLKRTAGTAAGATNKVIAELDFGNAYKDDGDAKKVYVRRADLPEESSVYAVKAADLENLPDNGLRLRDRRIWNFAGEEVTGVTVRVNGKPEHLVRKGPGQWNIASGSQAIIDGVAVEGGVHDLGDLNAAVWVECGAQNRAQYGFSGEPLQISLDVNHEGQARTFTVDFGGKSPLGRYAAVKMPDGQDWIFELAAEQMDLVHYCFNIHENAVP